MRIIVEAVTNHELVFDLKPEIVRIDVTRAAFPFTQKHTDPDTARSRGLQPFANRSQGMPAIEDVVENQDMSIFHVRRRDLIEYDFAAGLRFAVITRHAQTIEA